MMNNSTFQCKNPEHCFTLNKCWTSVKNFKKYSMQVHKHMQKNYIHVSHRTKLIMEMQTLLKPLRMTKLHLKYITPAEIKSFRTVLRYGLNYFFYELYLPLKKKTSNEWFFKWMIHYVSLAADVEIWAVKHTLPRTKLSVRIFSYLEKYLDGDNKHLLDVILLSSTVEKPFGDVWRLVIKKVLDLKGGKKFLYSEYIRHILVCKKWADISRSKNQKLEIIKTVCEVTPLPTHNYEVDNYFQVKCKYRRNYIMKIMKSKCDIKEVYEKLQLNEMKSDYCQLLCDSERPRKCKKKTQKNKTTSVCATNTADNPTVACQTEEMQTETTKENRTIDKSSSTETGVCSVLDTLPLAGIKRLLNIINTFNETLQDETDLSNNNNNISQENSSINEVQQRENNEEYSRLLYNALLKERRKVAKDIQNGNIAASSSEQVQEEVRELISVGRIASNVLSTVNNDNFQIQNSTLSYDDEVNSTIVGNKNTQMGGNTSVNIGKLQEKNSQKDVGKQSDGVIKKNSVLSTNNDGLEGNCLSTHDTGPPNRNTASCSYQNFKNGEWTVNNKETQKENAIELTVNKKLCVTCGNQINFTGNDKPTTTQTGTSSHQSVPTHNNEASSHNTQKPNHSSEEPSQNSKASSHNSESSSLNSEPTSHNSSEALGHNTEAHNHNNKASTHQCEALSIKIENPEDFISSYTLFESSPTESSYDSRMEIDKNNQTTSMYAEESLYKTRMKTPTNNKEEVPMHEMDNIEVDPQETIQKSCSGNKRGLSEQDGKDYNEGLNNLPNMPHNEDGQFEVTNIDYPLIKIKRTNPLATHTENENGIKEEEGFTNENHIPNIRVVPFSKMCKPSKCKKAKQRRARKATGKTELLGSNMEKLPQNSMVGNIHSREGDSLPLFYVQSPNNQLTNYISQNNSGSEASCNLTNCPCRSNITNLPQINSGVNNATPGSSNRCSLPPFTDLRPPISNTQQFQANQSQAPNNYYVPAIQMYNQMPNNSCEFPNTMYNNQMSQIGNTELLHGKQNTYRQLAQQPQSANNYPVLSNSNNVSLSNRYSQTMTLNTRQPPNNMFNNQMLPNGVIIPENMNNKLLPNNTNV